MTEAIDAGHDAEDEDAGGADASPGALGTGQLPLATAGRPRARSHKALNDPDDAAPESPAIWGAISEQATFWAIYKLGIGNEFGVCSWGAPGETAELREWPLSQLSEETILSRWGAGTYKCMWLKVTARGGRKSLPYGRIFTLRAPTTAAAPSGPVVLDPVAQHVAFMRTVRSEAAEGMTSVIQIAQLLAGGNRRDEGLSLDGLRLLMREERDAMNAALAAQQAANTAAIAAAVEPLHRAVAALSEEESDTVGAVASAAGSALGKRKGWLGALSFLAENPELAKVGTSVLTSAFDTVRELVKASRVANEAQAAQAAAAAARPRAEPRITVAASPPVEPVPAPAPVVTEESEQEAAWARLPVDAPTTRANGAAGPVTAAPAAEGASASP